MHLVLLLLAQVIEQRLVCEMRLLSIVLLFLGFCIHRGGRALRLGFSATAGVAVQPLRRVGRARLARAALGLYLLHDVLRQRLLEQRTGIVALLSRPRLGLLDPAHHLLDGVDVRRLRARLAHGWRRWSVCVRMAAIQFLALASVQNHSNARERRMDNRGWGY